MTSRKKNRLVPGLPELYDKTRELYKQTREAYVQTPHQAAPLNPLPLGEGGGEDAG